MGAVWLEVEPQRSMGEPEIRTLLSAGKMTVNFHGSRSITGGTLHFTLRDAADGSTVWQGSRPWAPEVELDYIAPKLWSPDNPNLYYMDIEWRDEAGRPADRCTRRFGFREFKIAGNQYLLNGRPVILRADTDYMKIVWATDWHLNAEHLRREFRLLKRFCINAVYTQDSQPSAIADIADEEGMLLLTANVVPYRELEKLSEAELADMTTQYLETAKKERKFYNHPSRVAWIIDIWFNYHNGATNGEYIGLKYGVKSYPAFDADGRQVVKSKPDPNLTQPMRMARMKRLNDRAALFSKHFPDMPAFTGGSGEVNGVYSTHIYHTWGAPRMELRALFSRYAMQPDLPVFIGEHNIPYAGSYYQLAQPYSVANGGISLFMENFARDAGDRAYLYPPVYTRRPLHGWGKESLQDGIHDKDPWNSYSIYSPMYLETLSRNVSAMIPAWRAGGVNGYGMFGCIYNNFVQAGHQLPRFVPVSGDVSAPDFKPETLVGGKAPLGFEPFGDTLDIRPTLAATPYLNAMADTICAFFAAGVDPLEDNHSFFSGADFAQDLIVMNDAGKAKEWRLVLSLASADGQRFWEHQEELRIGAGEHRKVPVRFTLPQVDLRSEWLLSATLVPPAGNEVLRTTKAVQIFPRPVPPALNRRLYLYDPEGILTVALKKLGLNFTALPNLLDIPLDGAVVIGRRAFSLSSEVPDLCALAARGAQILVLEQEQNSSMELMKVRTRDAFINAAAHPLLQGFKDADFASWSGSHAIAAPYQSGTNGTQWADFGNRNMVAAYVFRRPQQGNYRSLLVSGFDLFQTPLLEYSDRGSWIASTLEITERVGWDPVPPRICCCA